MLFVFFQVTGSSDRYYYIFPDINFCLCPAYSHYVLSNKSQITCKHVLACLLAVIMKKMVTHEVGITDFNKIRKSVISEF